MTHSPQKSRARHRGAWGKGEIVLVWVRDHSGNSCTVSHDVPDLIT